MQRSGKDRIIFSGSVTWSAGSTVTSAATLPFSLPISAGLTTLLHEVIFSQTSTSSISVDIRPVNSIGGSSVNGDLGVTATIPGVSTVKGVSVGGVNTIVRGLFNNATGIMGFLPSSSASATVTVSCIIQELEGT